MFFDIDWRPVKTELTAKLLLPILGDQYGRVLERGELQLAFNAGTLGLKSVDQSFR
jgi:(1->4)-alpha-D-glucan 1-alpha-D-glucosylmutase